MRSGSFALMAVPLLLGCQALALPEPASAPPVDVAGEFAGGGDEIVVCGQRFSTGAPVVLWFEDPEYNAYATEPRFSKEGPTGLRYRPGRAPSEASTLDASTLEALRERVDLFVLHYDVCGTSRTCFKVLQDQRQLSVHFLLDVDGTIYQTLDLQEQTWHARQANPRSIGIEIAHIGAYPPGNAAPLDDWYDDADGQVRLTIPARLGDGGVRTPDFRGRPARDERVTGEIQGDELVQYDFTPEQYDSLTRLTRTLARVFPRITIDAPRGPDGSIRQEVLSDDELARFHGIVGHYHVSASKSDPGPAFDWDRFLEDSRADPGAAVSPRSPASAVAPPAPSARPR